MSFGSSPAEVVVPVGPPLTQAFVVGRLRRKLGGPQVIETTVGAGCRLSALNPTKAECQGRSGIMRGCAVRPRVQSDSFYRLRSKDNAACARTETTYIWLEQGLRSVSRQRESANSAGVSSIVDYGAVAHPGVTK